MFKGTLVFIFFRIQSSIENVIWESNHDFKSDWSLGRLDEIKYVGEAWIIFL